MPRTPSLELSVLPTAAGSSRTGSKLQHLVIGTLRPTERGGKTCSFTAFTHRWCYGAEGNRTPDLCSAIAALSQLSYSPARHTCASQSRGLRPHLAYYKSPAISRGGDKRLHLNR